MITEVVADLVCVLTELLLALRAAIGSAIGQVRSPVALLRDACIFEISAVLHSRSCLARTIAGPVCNGRTCRRSSRSGRSAAPRRGATF
jgi:hypothetical protein